MTRPYFRAPRRQAGFTLVELMVSLVIGFAIVGALLAAYMASFRGSRHNDAMVQMAEDATLALNVMRAQTAMAGYSAVFGVDSSGALKVHAFTPVFGCAASQFGDLKPEAGAAVPCSATAAPSDTLEVAYEASSDSQGSNDILGSGTSANVPLDCLGNSLTGRNDSYANPWYLNDSKFYVQNGALYCYPSNATAGAPLVDHVEKLRVTYGLSDGTTTNQIVTYAPAPALLSGDWKRLVSVTICIEVRSAERVLDSSNVASLGTYVDCSGTRQTTQTDGYLRRSFATTVVLQNRLL
jgi:type IV pilus assembly protein PilW